MGALPKLSRSRRGADSGEAAGSQRGSRLPLALPKALVAVLTAGLLVSGCSFSGVQSLPLPGGADVGENPYTVKIHFRDVTDLVPNAGVKVNNVPVGTVTSVELAADSWLAEVTVKVNGDVELPANARASIKQSSLLGEKYVALSEPPKGEQPHGKLSDGELIGVARTDRGPEVEEVLGALSLLLNGGGIAQIQNIAEELNKALDGREADVRSLLSNLDTLVTKLDSQKNDITAALDSVNRLSATLKKQRDSIDEALAELGPGIEVLNKQREQLVTMLESLDKLSAVATKTVKQTKEDLVHNLEALQPVLRNLAEAGKYLPESLEMLFTYPFPDSVMNAIKGDYANLYVKVDLTLGHILKNLGRSSQPLIKLPEPSSLLPLPLGNNDASQPAKDKQESSDDSDDSSGGILGFLLGGN